MMSCYSQTDVSGSPFQAWRAGFREGVKMTLLNGVKVPSQEIKERIWWHNLHRLRIWSTIGAHEQNGLFSILGARQGTYMTNCTDWDYVQVRDFDFLNNLYKTEILHLENNINELQSRIVELGSKLKINLGLHWIDLDADQSRYTYELYHETINMSNTYYNRQ